MGEAEPIEPRREVRALSLRLARRTRRKPRTPIARIAKKPRTTITAIPQWGKSECELDCKLPGVAVARNLELETAAADAEAADAEDAEAAATAADDEDAKDDVTESAYVVSAGHWSIRVRSARTMATLTNCTERCLGGVGAVQRLVCTSYYPVIRICD
jgi:hypothetical protein